MQQDIATTRSIEGGGGHALTIGLDVGDRYTHVCVLGSRGEVVRERRVRTTAPALGGALEDLPQARVVIEAGPRSPWLSRRVAGAAGALRPGVARPDPPQERAEPARPRRGARP